MFYCNCANVLRYHFHWNSYTNSLVAVLRSLDVIYCRLHISVCMLFLRLSLWYNVLCLTSAYYCILFCNICLFCHICATGLFLKWTHWLVDWLGAVCYFLSRVSMPMRAERNTVVPILSVCRSVRLSVQCRYCVKTNGHIVTLSTLW